MLSKHIASFFAALMLVFSVTCHSPAVRVVSPERWSAGEEMAWVSPAATPGIVAKESSTSHGPQNWRPEISIPGLFFRRDSSPEVPRMQIIRKIYVVDASAYAPCKSLLLFPFHEFS